MVPVPPLPSMLAPQAVAGLLTRHKFVGALAALYARATLGFACLLVCVCVCVCMFHSDAGLASVCSWKNLNFISPLTPRQRGGGRTATDGSKIDPFDCLATGGRISVRSASALYKNYRFVGSF